MSYDQCLVENVDAEKFGPKFYILTLALSKVAGQLASQVIWQFEQEI